MVLPSVHSPEEERDAEEVITSLGVIPKVKARRWCCWEGVILRLQEALSSKKTTLKKCLVSLSSRSNF